MNPNCKAAGSTNFATLVAETTGPVAFEHGNPVIETSLKKPVIEKGMLQASLCETLSIGVKHTMGFGKTNARHAKFCTDLSIAKL